MIKVSNHCRGCHGHVYDERREECLEHTFDTYEGREDCPGCQECERLKDVVRHAEYWEARRKEERDALAAECERLRAELLSVRESLQRERAGQVKCNSGHVSDRALWDCPICVQRYRDRLATFWRAANVASDAPVDAGDSLVIGAIDEVFALRARLTKAERFCRYFGLSGDGRGIQIRRNEPEDCWTVAHEFFSDCEREN